MVIERFGVYVVALDPVVGAEMSKTRPCVIVTPDEMNETLRTVIIAPLTTGVRNFPFRVNSHFAGKHGQIALDQMRVVDKRRLAKRIGVLDGATSARLRRTLVELFG